MQNKKLITLTFDDTPYDTWSIALPLLAKHKRFTLISEDIAHAANDNGFKIVNWSHYSFDDSVKSEATPKERCDKAFSSTYGIRDGDIFLIHPSSEEIIQGVALLIDRLKSENFEILSLSEHFERKNGGINVCYGPIF